MDGNDKKSVARPGLLRYEIAARRLCEKAVVILIFWLELGRKKEVYEKGRHAACL